MDYKQKAILKHRLITTLKYVGVIVLTMILMSILDKYVLHLFGLDPLDVGYLKFILISSVFYFPLFFYFTSKRKIKVIEVNE
ncbi:MAG: hypothetical protein N4A44_03330 [Alphaproteobacteria bacterium]|jgi:O-antigen/teichoic acid export membrane protein|nr:hypothetical protein [Alphaproteobacteria bacterium]